MEDWQVIEITKGPIKESNKPYHGKLINSLELSEKATQSHANELWKSISTIAFRALKQVKFSHMDLSGK
jgi:hypothetical protein